MFKFINEKHTLEIFQDHVFMLPAISVGNVGQLACDLLISSLNMKKVGYFCAKCFLPVVGNNPYMTSDTNQDILSISSEVYISRKLKVTILQLRSPLAKGKKAEFCDAVVDWFKSCKFSDMIILSSCHAFERTDDQLVGFPFRYLASPDHPAVSAKFDAFKWKPLEERTVGYGDRSLFLPGGGFTKKLFLSCCSEDIRVVVLLLFCAEGDNIPEAMTIVQRVNQWRQLLPTNENDVGCWKPPASWSHLFGNAPPREIF